jgi:protein-S-isoprenylcysteine O-methyltransferase Ste14
VASLGVVLYGIAVTVAGHMVVIYVEEPELHKRFGQSYEIYSQNVPRWFPRLHSKRSTSR